MRQREPADPLEATVGKIADRVDGHETRITGLHRLIHEKVEKDIEALGRGLASVLGDQDEKNGGQRNWLAIPDNDPQTAYEWATDLHYWVRDVYAWMVSEPLPDCWLWHPPAVVTLLAISAQWNAAYTSSSPSAVSDLLARWLEKAMERLSAEFHDCQGQVHRNEWEVDPEQGEAYAHWWATSRKGDPPGLKRL